MIAHAAATDDMALERARLQAAPPGWSIGRSRRHAARGRRRAPDRHARRREQTRARPLQDARKLFARQRRRQHADRRDHGRGRRGLRVLHNHFESKAAIVEVGVMEAVAAHGEAVDADDAELDALAGGGSPPLIAVSGRLAQAPGAGRAGGRAWT